MMQVKRINPYSELKILGVIISISVILRLVAAVWMGDQVIELPGTTDQISYHTLAQRVLAGEGFTFPQAWWPATAAGAPTAHWSFLYTFFLVAVYAIFGVHPLAARLIQAVLVGILHPWLVYLLGRSYLGEKVGLIAAALTSIYIYFIYYNAALMTESLYITAILSSLLLTVKLSSRNLAKKRIFGGDLWLGIWFGISLGVVVLMRQLFLLLIPFLFLWLLWAGGWKKLSPIIFSTIILVGMIAPFTLYNYARFNRFVLLNTNSGFAFFWGNHPSYGSHFIPILPAEAYALMIPKELLSLDEAALDQALLKRALGFIQDDPIRYLELSVSRIPAYFNFWPSKGSGLVSNISRVGSFGLALPFFLYGLFLSIKKKNMFVDLGVSQSKIRFLLIGFVVIYTGIHLLIWALVRYRLPVDAVLIIFAGLALNTIVARFNSR